MSSRLAGADITGLGLISVELVTGETTLPDEIQALRFRVEEVQLRDEGGDWVSLPADLNSFEILPDRNLSKSILTTRVEPVLYDSIALKISEVFVLYDENAGGPLSWPQNSWVKSELNALPEVDRAVRIQVIFEPEASLLKDEACRWYFIPFWRIRIG